MSKANKGSAKYIQAVANITECKKVFSDALNGHQIKWLSPLRGENYKEYRDGPFIDKVFKEALTPSRDSRDAKAELRKFWPKGGPHWDGIAYDMTANEVLLIEAKGHISEITSKCKAKAESSKNLIRKNLGKVSSIYTGIHDYSKLERSWQNQYYQTANRLFTIWFFREILKVNVRLINLIFYNLTEMNGEDEADFREKLESVHKEMQISRECKLLNYITDVYIDASKIQL